MTLKELEKFVNELAKQHQHLVERVNNLEKTQRASLGNFLIEDKDAVKKLKAAAYDLHKSIYCGSQ